ncbi:MAG: hypothetical protein AAGA96_09565 [Verrucomicrobiota bacterium]
MSAGPFAERVTKKLSDLASRHSLSIRCEGTPGTQNGEVVYFENDSFSIVASNERSEESIHVYCKIRPRPRAHLRNYSIGSLSAFLDGKTKPHPLRDFTRDADDLIRLENECLSVETLNSEELRDWEKAASRAFWGNRKGQQGSDGKPDTVVS